MVESLDYEFENRDIKQAASVGKMVALGKFPQEFTAYGCCFVENGQQKYWLSAKAENVYDFIYADGYAANYPTPCQSLSRFYLVPSGTWEYFNQLTKLDLAQELREIYPESLLLTLGQFAAGFGSDRAEPVLSDLCERLWGKFQADDLQLFDALLKTAYRRKILQPATYAAFQDWLAKEQRQVADDAAIKDLFAKTLYGVVYYHKNGRRVSYFSADKATVYRLYERISTEGLLVSPLFQKTYWYNYQYRLYDVRKDFERYLNERLDETYFTYLRALMSLPGAVAQTDYADFCQHMLRRFGPQISPILLWYGLCWGTAPAA